MYVSLLHFYIFKYSPLYFQTEIKCPDKRLNDNLNNSQFHRNNEAMFAPHSVTGDGVLPEMVAFSLPPNPQLK